MKTINIDRISKRKDYEELDGLLVTSMFRTIQGEGPFAGHPSVFLRLAGCNFGNKEDFCSFCDTKFHFDEGKLFRMEDLLKELKSLPGYAPTDILVITGGEPTLQHRLLSFMYRAEMFFERVQIETNGTQAYFFNQFVPNTQISIVVSPKASIKLKGYPKTSQTVLDKTDCLKFVVSADPLSPHHEVPQWAFDAVANSSRRIKLYVSPMAEYLKEYPGEVSSIWEDGLIDKEATARNYAYAAQYAMANHCLLSLQTHLFTAVP